jgi:hypothetical protein
VCFSEYGSRAFLQDVYQTTWRHIPENYSHTCVSGNHIWFWDWKAVADRKINFGLNCFSTFENCYLHLCTVVYKIEPWSVIKFFLHVG